MKKRTRKQQVRLDHDQKRMLAKQVVGGKLVKQAAAEFGVSLDCAHKIVQEYTITFRTERYPIDGVQRQEYECTP